MIEVYFGETLYVWIRDSRYIARSYGFLGSLPDNLLGFNSIGSSFHLASDTNPEDALDKRGRFVMFDSVKVGEVRQAQ